MFYYAKKDQNRHFMLQAGIDTHIRSEKKRCEGEQNHCLYFRIQNLQHFLKNRFSIQIETK